MFLSAIRLLPLRCRVGCDFAVVGRSVLINRPRQELFVRSGQTHVQRYTMDLLRRIGEGEIDTTFLISHRLPLEEAPTGYRNFRDKQNEWTKVVLRPY